MALVCCMYSLHIPAMTNEVGKSLNATMVFEALQHGFQARKVDGYFDGFGLACRFLMSSVGRGGKPGCVCWGGGGGIGEITLA